MDARFDVVVIGGGHAGCEAAAAAARMGARTALVTHRFATIGAMSCNPAIGGLGKGHLVREIDALDGLMGRVADAGGIQFRVLNRRKGPAVRGPRAQQDRRLYAAAMQAAVRDCANLSVIEGEADDLLVRMVRVSGIRLGDGRVVGAGAVVLTTGTFLRGLIHIGEQQTPAGRVGEAPAVGLSLALERIGFALGRLKTGTPPRLDGRTIAWSRLEMQPGDDPPEPFSALTERIDRPQIDCAITRTTAETHAIIRANVHRSPMYSGQIQSRGPRYCPSIEDKIVRFGERDGHQIFLEPEGLDDPTVYPNGISTSLPEEVQRAFVATIPGLETARDHPAGLRDRIRPRRPPRAPPDAGDQAPPGPVPGRPDQRHHRLRGGGRAGPGRRAQCGGAGRRRSRNPVRPRGELSRGHDRRPRHPRRHRALPHVHLAGRIPADPAGRQCRPAADRRAALRWAASARPRRRAFEAKLGALDEARARRPQPERHPNRGPALRLLAQPGRPAAQRLRAPVLSRHRHGRTSRASGRNFWRLPPAIAAQVETDAKYAVYLERQAADVAAFRRDEAVELPAQLDYDAVPGLSNESRQKLAAARPRTIGHASRIDGITPAALTLLAAHVRRGRFGNAKRAAR